MTSDLDAVDRQIICMLQRDGRASNVDVARRVGISEATVRKRLDRLLADGVIQIAALPDATRLGFSTVTFIAFSVDPAQIERIADQLARSPQVRAIYYTTGESDLLVEAWFPSSEELLQFLTRHVASIPGIYRTATWHVLRTIKDPGRWVLPPGAPPRVLVVDDDPDFVEVTRLTLAANGFEVMLASNGEEALALMRLYRPDLVILDVMMRGVLDGLQTAKEMRADGGLRTVPILMVSSITDSAFAGLWPQGETLPADNFLTKPVDRSVLLAEARRLVRFRAS